jgi:hypothetical protein
MAGKRRPAAPWVLAIAAGTVLWFAASLLGGRREARASPPCWSPADPLAIRVTE